MSQNVEEKTRERLYSKGIYVITKVTIEEIDNLISWIVNNRPQKNKFTILINSGGGSPLAVIRFASFLNALEDNVIVKGVAFETCGSAALALLQCCHTRFAVRPCTFFIHHIHTTITLNCQKPDMKKIELEIASSKMLEDELVRIQSAKTGITRRQWMRLADHGEYDADTPISVDKARKLGLIDKVINRFPCL